jgi:hypothetical protein
MRREGDRRHTTTPKAAKASPSIWAPTIAALFIYNHKFSIQVSNIVNQYKQKIIIQILIEKC